MKAPEGNEPALYTNWMGHVVKSSIKPCAGTLSGALYGEFWMMKVLDERIKAVLAFCNLEKEELACNRRRRDDRPHRPYEARDCQFLESNPRCTSTVRDF